MQLIIWSIVFGSLTGTMCFRDPRIPFLKEDGLKFVDDQGGNGGTKQQRRCGVCPTYFQKICAFDISTNQTFIFDNHCIMDMYNCVYGTVFQILNFDHCLFFGNFAYVHGFKKADMDYEEGGIILKGSKKNPDFAR